MTGHAASGEGSGEATGGAPSVAPGGTRGGSLAWRAFRAQTRMELLLATRRSENLLVTLVVPVLLLLFFSTLPLLPEDTGGLSLVDRLVPAILAVAVMSTGLVSLGIATAFERSYGVLKRLGGSPLPRWALLAAKSAVVALTVLLQLVLVCAVALILGWEPPGGPLVALAGAVPWLLLGTLAFCGLGLLLAGTLRAEAVLAAANGLFLLFVFLGGVIVPLSDLPALIGGPASVLPPALLAELLRGTLQPGEAVDPIHAAGLAAWAIGLLAAVMAVFRVD